MVSFFFYSSAPHVLGILIPVLAMCYAYYFHSSLLINAIFGSTSLLVYGSCIQLSNRTDRTNDNPPESCEHEVVNEMQFSDRQLHLTGRLSLSIRTGCTMAISDRVS